MIALEMAYTQFAFFSYRGTLISILVEVIAVTILMRILLNVFNNLFWHSLKSVPGPLPAKVLPHYMQLAVLKGTRCHMLLQLHDKYGPYVRIGPNEVSISDYQLYRKIYNHTSSVKERSFYASTRLTPPHENIFSMRNKAQHAARRKIENYPYSLRTISEHEPEIIAKADRFLQRIITESAASETHTVDVQPLCGLFSLEVICQVAFNQDIDAESSKTGLTYLSAMGQALLIQPISNTLPILAKTRLSEFLSGIIGQAYAQRRIWEDMTREMYREFVNNAPEAPSDKFLADPFIHKEDEYLGRKLTEGEAIEEAMGLAFAGSGTTATTILYILYHLSRPENRTMQLRLREELHSTGTKDSDITDLKYLGAVIKEAMRLNPSLIGSLPRVLTTAIEAGQGKSKFIFLPGTLISMQNYVHHRDSNVYAEPHTFNPDRWIGVSQSSAVEKAFTPYSLGPRSCIGQNLANLEIRLAVSHLFRHLDFRLNPEMKESEMEMEDRFAALTRGGRLMLDVGKL